MHMHMQMHNERRPCLAAHEITAVPKRPHRAPDLSFDRACLLFCLEHDLALPRRSCCPPRIVSEADVKPDRSCDLMTELGRGRAERIDPVQCKKLSYLVGR